MHLLLLLLLLLLADLLAPCQTNCMPCCTCPAHHFAVQQRITQCSVYNANTASIQ
jgi:hypothetical protein